MWEELQQKINDSPARVEWSSDGECGRGELTKINISDNYIEFLINDDRPEVGSFLLGSLRNIVGIASIDGENLNIFSDYMGNITILHKYKWLKL